MHEASLAQGLLKLVLESVEKHNKNNPNSKVIAIKEINCSAGIITCVEDQTLKACFELFAEKTMAEGASINISRDEIHGTCKDCGKEFLIKKKVFICPDCLSHNIDFEAKHGLILEELNVEIED